MRSWEDITVPVDLLTRPPLDRAALEDPSLSPEQRAYARDGLIVMRGLIPPEVMDPYISARAARPIHGPGWPTDVAYMIVPELRRLCLYPPLVAMLRSFIGEDPGLHLNLTNWTSTERNWHQDAYLNGPHNCDWYAAVWIALGDIHPDCGPFQFVRGSHRMPRVMDGQQIQRMLPAELRGATWPKESEAITDPICEAMANAAGYESFVPASAGDVLIWHPRLLHRGSRANVPGMERRAVIAHYSGVAHQPWENLKVCEETGGHYWEHKV